MRSLISLLCGALFGIGLVVSDMVNPARVTGFLDLAGQWDPATLFVFVGALTASGLLHWIARMRARPLFDDRFHLPQRTDVDRRLVAGSVLFGLGWGLSGFCPGPLLAALAQPTGDILLFALSLFAGMALFRLLPRRDQENGPAGPAAVPMK